MIRTVLLVMATYLVLSHHVCAATTPSDTLCTITVQALREDAVSPVNRLTEAELRQFLLTTSTTSKDLTANITQAYWTLAIDDSTTVVVQGFDKDGCGVAAIQLSVDHFQAILHGEPA